MIPSEIGRYEIESELGRGGMAVVYLARDPYMTREVAVKVLPAQLTVDPQFRARFQREAQVIAALDHPAIVPVYDFGEHEGRPYLVMRHMAGGSLADRLKKQGSLSVVEAARVLERVGSALDEAHQKGIVHRDLKPDNILFDDRGEPFVGDFGIVKISEATVAYTGSNVIGTPGYMSPEQVQGEEDIDGRTDVYALGAIAYEMLTGRLPYHSDTPVGLMMQHVTAPVPDILTVRPDLPAGCAPVIARAMAKSREERFATCTGVALALAEAAYTAPDPRRTAATVAQGESVETVVEPLPDTRSTTAGTGVPDAKVAEEKSRGFPLWALAIGGCLGLLICGGAVAGLLGLGALGGIFGGDTPTTQAVATVQPIVTGEPTVVVPTAIPEIEVDFSRLDNDEIGVSLSYPSDWYAQQDAEFTVVADQQRLVDDLGDFDSGAIAIVIADNRGEFQGESPVEMLQFALDRFDLTAEASLLNGPSASTINGQEAATAELGFPSEGGREILGTAALIANNDRVAFVVAATPADFESENRPTLQAIVDSVSVGEPSQPPQLDGTEGVVAIGDVVAGSVAQGSVSRWNLVGLEGEVIDIVVEPQSDDFDLIVDVLDDTGASILEEGEVDAAFGTEEIIGVQLPYSGDYVVSIMGFLDAAGDYELSVEASEQIAGTSGPGSIIFASATLGDGEEHAFPFSTDLAGATVIAGAEPQDGFDIVLSLYDDDNNELLDEMDESFGFEELNVVVSGAGNYYFNVSGFDGSGGDYEISLAGPPEILFELAKGDEVQGRFDDTAQIDYYYSGTAGEPIMVIVTPEGDLDVVVEILDGLGENSLVEADDWASGEAEEIASELPEEALYIIRVKGFAGQVGSFFLSLE
jgi:predicted Ser/Thr protein kinase